MEEETIYDDASLHFNGQWPEGLPQFQAYVHTGFYLGWVISSKLYSKTFSLKYAATIKKYINGALTGPQLFQSIGGIFTADMLSQMGNEFTSFYFDLEKGRYLTDYGHLLADRQKTAYHVPDTLASYECIAQRIQQQFDYWEKNRKL